MGAKETNFGQTIESEDIAAGRMIKVNLALLDSLMTRVGELVLIRNQVLQHAERHGDPDLVQVSKRLDLVTTELQNEIMKTRMRSLRSVTDRLARLVQDLARGQGKKVEFQLEGADAELDRSIIDVAREPLTQVVRYAIESGVETPAERLRAGKSESGLLSLRVVQDGEQVVIEVRDDGSGADPANVPGLFAARTMLENAGGRLELKCIGGKGCSVSIRIPLTMAIVPTLLVQAADQVFAIPQLKLSSLVNVERGADGLYKGLDCVEGNPVLRLRDALLPLLLLRDILRDKGGTTFAALQALERERLNVVVVNCDGREIGLVVDLILDSVEVVVKPLGKYAKHVGLFAGASVMGDGSVALILDVPGIFQTLPSAEVDLLEPMRVKRGGATLGGRLEAQVQEYLHVVYARGEPALIPLDQVHRLEDVALGGVSFSNGTALFPYRGELMPLVPLSVATALADGSQRGDRGDARSELEREAANPAGMQVVVVQRNAVYVGFVVKEIRDIVQTTDKVDDAVSLPCAFGNLVVDAEIFPVLDLFALADEVNAPIK